LNLGEFDVSADFLKKIGNITEFKHLELRSSKIDKAHWIALRKQLRSLPALETVKIGFVTQFKRKI